MTEVWLRVAHSQKYEKKCEILRLQTVLKSFYFVKRYIYRYKLKCNGDLGFIDIQENEVVEYLPSCSHEFEYGSMFFHMQK